VDAERLTSDPIQLAHLLQLLTELHRSEAISEREYRTLRERVLTALKLALEPTSGRPQIQDLAGELHRLITKDLAEKFPSGDRVSQTARREYLYDTVHQLLERGTLRHDDLPYMAGTIDMVTDDRFGSSIAQLERGFVRVIEIQRETMRSEDTTPLAKTITGIAADSAETAVATARSSRSAAGSDGQPVSRHSRIWSVVGRMWWARLPEPPRLQP
jgi:hypothetical protein